MTGIYGGSGRGLYASQLGDEENGGRLYRLEHGKAWPVTTFRYHVRHDYPGLYVSRSGRILNWAEGMLTIYARSEWHRVDPTGPIHDAHVLDAGDDLYFLASGQRRTIQNASSRPDRDISAQTAGGGKRWPSATPCTGFLSSTSWL